ncbi:MAG: hypothetical protein ACQEQU_08885 [Spirochaetota bacterium]
MLDRTRQTVLAILNVIGLITALTLNALANALPLNGRNTGDISDSIPNLFVPAGLTFSIWGLIYALLVIMIIYQIRTLVRGDNPNPAIERLGIWFFISCLANAAWIIAWHWSFLIVSLIIMLVLLGSLITMHTRIRKEFFDHEITPAFKVAVSLPISIYLGWITVATIANITAVLVVFDWNRFGLSEPFWTVVVIGAAVIVNLLAVIMKGDIWFALVGIWALLGIYLKRTSADVEPIQSVIIAALIGIVILTAAIIARIIIRHRTLTSNSSK